MERTKAEWPRQTLSALLANYHRPKDDSFTHSWNLEARRVPQARFLCLGLGLDFSPTPDILRPQRSPPSARMNRELGHSRLPRGGIIEVYFSCFASLPDPHTSTHGSTVGN
jgi:hypothetical protein